MQCHANEADKSIRAEEARQERELQKQRDEQAASLRALEEQVKAGKLKKAEEKKRREAAKKDAADKEARLEAQRAEIEAAKEKERQLRAQLENMDDGDGESSDEDDPKYATPDENTPTASMVLPENPSEPAAAPPAPPPMPPAPPMPAKDVTSPPAESKNPFFKSMNLPSAAGTPPGSSAGQKVDTNPFHRQSISGDGKTALPEPVAAPARSRSKPADDDDWSVVESSSDDDEDDDAPQGGSAKHLASILFGTMAPPRPLSSMEGTGSTPASPAPASGGFASPPPAPSGTAPPPPPMPPSGGAPPPPPMPPSGGPPPPPGPPPMPSSSGAGPAVSSPPAGLSDRNGLLQQIQAGKGLKKTATKDRSVSSVAGKVL